MRDLSTLCHFFLYSVIYLCQYRLMDNNFIFWVLIHYFFIFMDQLPYLWSAFSWLFWYPPINGFVALPYFLALQVTIGSSCRFSGPVLKLDISPRGHGCFYWKKKLRNKIWVLCALIVPEVLFIPDPFKWKSKEIYLCVPNCACTHTCKCFYNPSA